MMTVPMELARSYELCRRIHRRYDPTYYWATRRLPSDVRPAVHALYGFVRGADELVDGPRRPSDPAARLAALDAWEGELSSGLATGRSDHPVIAALVDAGARHDLPLDELRVYMRSMRVDCGRVRIATAEELDGYMQGSAGSVGRIMAALLDVPESQRPAYGDMGLAFQLTNFIRDVPEDWTLDRLYLPREELERHGVGEPEIARGEATAGFRALMASQTARARALFASTEAGVAAASPRVQPSIRLARSVYAGVLDRVERIGFDVFRHRTSLPPWELGGAAWRALRAA
jgi:15-cis-phytoene synthase